MNILFLKIIIFLGDNRDCSKDSRFLSEVGYVHKNNSRQSTIIIFRRTQELEVLLNFGSGIKY